MGIVKSLKSRGRGQSSTRAQDELNGLLENEVEVECDLVERKTERCARRFIKERSDDGKMEVNPLQARENA